MILCFTACRVYKNFDPRAKIIREVAEEVFEIQGRDPLIDVAVELEKRARSDDYFVSRNLYPNVDFYSGAQSIPVVFFKCPILLSIRSTTSALANFKHNTVLLAHVILRILSSSLCGAGC